jgi:hypothetical protein
MKSLQKTLVSTALKKISADRFHTLSGIEIYAYVKYRIERFIKTKHLLVKDEIKYLLTETGPGNIRLTPEIVELLPLESVYISEEFKNSPQRDSLLAQKLSVQDYIESNTNSKETQDILLQTLGTQINDATKACISPLVIDGTYRGYPISCLIKNGEWITPNEELFNFISNCKRNSRFPILIAKKISGILFPIFKELSILGLNTYKSYLPKDITPMLDAIRLGQDEFSEIKYYNQFFPSHSQQKADLGEENTGNNPLIDFFSLTLKINIAKYNDRFFHSQITISPYICEILSQLKKNNTTKRLIKAFDQQKRLYEEVAINFPSQLRHPIK